LSPDPEVTAEQKEAVNKAVHVLRLIDFHSGAPAHSQCLEIISFLRDQHIPDEDIEGIIFASNIGLNVNTIRRYLKEELEQTNKIVDMCDKYGTPTYKRRSPPELPDKRKEVR